MLSSMPTREKCLRSHNPNQYNLNQYRLAQLVAVSRHKITLVLNNLSDLKVEEGQRINVGDIISDRTQATERTKLQAKKQRLSASLSRARLPLRRTKTRPST